MQKDYQKYLAELIGTFALVFVGAGAVVVNAITGGDLGLLGIALAHGFTLMAMIFVFGNISGTHINPAVTVAMVVARKMKVKEGVFYIFSQLVGAIIAGFALFIIFPKAPASIALGTTMLNEVFGITFSVGILIEIILTFFLVLTIFALVFDKRNSTPFAGFAIGMVLAFSIMIGGPLTGAALNPARAFGPAIVSQFFSNHLVYWIGPIVGAIMAALFYKNYFLGEKIRLKN